ncbi:MAG: Gfo/Idh/MocA family protein [Pirellulales bacterium]
MTKDLAPENRGTTRRTFIKGTAATVVGAGLSAHTSIARTAHAAGDDKIKVGLIGCGGRGRGAAMQAIKADPHTHLVALADTFADQIELSLTLFGRDGELSSRVDVPEDRRYVGFDAFQQLIDSDVDVVLLAAPPHFRPQHLEAAVAAGKHVFAEKPIAVDVGGVQRVLAACEQAKQKNLAVVSGLCWRYENHARAAMQQIHDGKLGQIVAMHSAYVGSMPGKAWPMVRQDGWGDMEWQLRNWYWFTWLSGDHIVEQAVHSIDKASWAMHDQPPQSAISLGGLQARRGPELGTIFDHHAVLFEYPSGLKHFHYCRQQSGCAHDVSTHIVGTLGVCDVEKGVIRNHDGDITWKANVKKNIMHQQEQDELFASIRAGQPINDGHYMSVSTMLAVLGRMASYTGRKVTWDQALQSKEDYTLPQYNWDVKPEIPPIAIPGVTLLV